MLGIHSSTMILRTIWMPPQVMSQVVKMIMVATQIVVVMIQAKMDQAPVPVQAQMMVKAILTISPTTLAVTSLLPKIHQQLSIFNR